MFVSGKVSPQPGVVIPITPKVYLGLFESITLLLATPKLVAFCHYEFI
jgi:hypothetical protein